MSVAENILEVEALDIVGPRGALVRSVTFAVGRGQVLALVGESGSGKTLSARAIIGLLPDGIRASGGAIRFGGEDLLSAAPERLRMLRGAKIGMVFQEPTAALNPVRTVGHQIEEVILAHRGSKKDERKALALAALEKVGLEPSAHHAYVHELSGGMAQRAMIAIATCLEPELLVADEATTALDTTTQAMILDLLETQRTQFGRSVLLISHDLGVVAKVADRIVVMKDGELVEQGTVDQIFDRPEHPYTRHLLDSSAQIGGQRA